MWDCNGLEIGFQAPNKSLIRQFLYIKIPLICLNRLKKSVKWEIFLVFHIKYHENEILHNQKLRRKHVSHWYRSKTFLWMLRIVSEHFISNLNRNNVFMKCLEKNLNILLIQQQLTVDKTQFLSKQNLLRLRKSILLPYLFHTF